MAINSNVSGKTLKIALAAVLPDLMKWPAAHQQCGQATALPPLQFGMIGWKTERASSVTDFALRLTLGLCPADSDVIADYGRSVRCHHALMIDKIGSAVVQHNGRFLG